MNKTLNKIPTITAVKKFFIANADQPKIILSSMELFGRKKVELIFNQYNKECKAIVKINNKIVFQNTLPKNKNRSIEEIYDFYDELPFIKAQIEKKEEKTVSENQKVELLFQDCLDEFNEFIGDSFDDDYMRMSEEELKNFVSRIATKKDEIKRLKKLNAEVNKYEENIKTYKKLPAKLLNLASTHKGTLSKLEKAIILKARRLILGYRLHREDKTKPFIDEFIKRSFPPEDSALAEYRNIPKEKNFIALMRIQLSKVNKWHKGHSTYDEALGLKFYKPMTKGQLELELWWEYEDVISYIYADVLENIYFFDTSKNVKLDTYVFTLIKNAVQKLKNLTILKDEKGARRESWKETKVIKKIQNAKYELAADNKEVNLQNVKDKISEYNDKVKHNSSKVRDVDVEKYYDSIVHQKYDDMSFQGEGENEVKTNDSLLKDLWEDTHKWSEYDPEGSYKKREVSEQIDGLLDTIVKTEEEKLILEFLLESLIYEKKKLKIDEKDFNSYYNNKLGFTPLSQKDVDLLVESVISKISVNRNAFRLATNIDF